MAICKSKMAVILRTAVALLLIVMGAAAGDAGTSKAKLPYEGVARGSRLIAYDFTGAPDGNSPVASLARDAGGNLYGTTFLGGVTGYGTVFEVDAQFHEIPLHSFSGGLDGGFPLANLVQGPDGDLYGTVWQGGDLNCNAPAGCGAVFKISKAGKETVLHSFTGGVDGINPKGGLIFDRGSIYGTTQQGGAFNCNPPAGCGAVFRLDIKTGRETALYSFAGGTDGIAPVVSLTHDAEGNLYGVTVSGGARGRGTIFKVTEGGVETILHSFSGGTQDGSAPYASLILDSSGNLYGTTWYGGNQQCQQGCGTVFKFDTKTGGETILHRFIRGTTDGNFPYGALVLDAKGNLYGTTELGGVVNDGTIFKVARDGAESLLYSFTGRADGGDPSAGLVLDALGNLYGTAFGFGTGNNGTVYELRP